MIVLTPHKIVLLCMLLSVLSPAIAHADVYTYVDERGVPTFTDVPGDSRAKLLWKEGRALAHEGLSVLVLAPSALKPDIDAAARANTLDPALLHALISVESGFNPRARSARGAQGLMQLMPATARRYGVHNAFDIKENLRAGAHYLHDLLALFDQNTSLALAAYNAGENAVIRSGNRIPPFPETQRYVPKVLAQFARLRDEYAVR
ncbi:MAG TPA: lytic transglycosylase domain-containing protein [Rhodocyclaceae bacterium]|nr:lytic transglycosylase domain-containing protein [Rhodocyclaceae bacterium]